jgi:hypothetical protein
MPKFRMPALDVQHRRALALLAATASGRTEAALLARGLRPILIGDLVRAGLATIESGYKFGGGRAVDMTCIKSTDAGRVALARR